MIFINHVKIVKSHSTNWVRKYNVINNEIVTNSSTEVETTKFITKRSTRKIGQVISRSLWWVEQPVRPEAARTRGNPGING